MLGSLFRVKFLVMSDRGPVAETEWSSETLLKQGMRPDEQVTYQGWRHGRLLRTGGGPVLVNQSHRFHPVVCRAPSPGRVGSGGSGGCSRFPFSGQIRLFSSLHGLPRLPVGLSTSRHSAVALQATPGPQGAGAIVIIAILSVLLTVLLTALLTLIIYTW